MTRSHRGGDHPRATPAARHAVRSSDDTDAGRRGTARPSHRRYASQGRDTGGGWYADQDDDAPPRYAARSRYASSVRDAGSLYDAGLGHDASAAWEGGPGYERGRVVGRRRHGVDPDERAAGGEGSGGSGSGGGGRKRRRRRRLRRVLVAFLVTGSIVLLAGVAAFVVGYIKTPIPDPNADLNANKTTLYYRDGASVLGGFAVQNRVSVPLDQVPRHVQDAVLAAENRTFWTDSGISLGGIIRAAWNQLRGGSRQSGSTITQQYVKNYYLTQEQTWSRKITELFVTLKIQRQLSKQEILQHYLNTSYFGRGAYGIEVAANAYFDTHVQDLSPHQAAVLASLLRAPSNYDPAMKEGNLERLEGRYRYVLRGMAEMGVIPASEVRAPLPEIRPAGDKRTFEGPRGHLLVQVRKELRKAGFTDEQIEAGGLRVTTTFDPKAQKALEEAVRKHFPKKNAKGVYAGAAAIRPGTGEVVAMYGGRDYLERQFNDATQAKLQPGSTFKPFALAAALEHGVSLESRFAGNSPFKLPDGDKVNNQFNRDYGRYVDLIQATRDSINTAYVDMTINAISPNDVVDAALRAGIPEDTPGLDRHAKVSLGFASVSPVDMANAFATFAVGGQRATWHVVAEVRDRSGAVVYRGPEETTVEFDSKVVRDVNYALQEVVRRGSGEREAKRLRRPAAGKTGTHEDETAWFVGYTPQLSAAVAFYKDADGDGVKESLDDVGGMDTFFGGGYPARIWAAFMRGALAGEPVQHFSPPARVGEPVNPSPTPTAAPEEPRSTEGPASPTPEPTTPWPTARPTLPPPPPPNPEPRPTDDPRRDPPGPQPKPEPQPPTPTPTTPRKRWPIPVAPLPDTPVTSTATPHDVE